MTPAAGGAPAVGGSSPCEPRAPGAPGAAGTRLRADVCVYGGTAAGVMAALAVAAAARSVVLVEPSRWLGGFVGGGIRVLRDCRYPDEVGGRTRTMMERDFLLGGGAHDRQAALRALFAELVGQAAVTVLFEHRLGRVALAGNRIRTLHLDRARPDRDGPPAAYPEAVDVVQVSAEVFIDAGYEGDLLAAAGVSYARGREAAREFGESLAGVRNLRVFDVDPYRRQGDSASGLLPMVSPEPVGEPGSASRYPMAYNFRPLWVAPGAGREVGEPSRYDPAEYALFRRALQAGVACTWPHDNYARRELMSGGIPGRQAEYPEADWSERRTIWRAFVDHVKIMHRLTGRRETLCPGEYPDSGDFPNQLYVRLARRMRGRYTMTQHDLMHQVEVHDAIGLGYGWLGMVDIYPCRLVATRDGRVASEGEVFVRVSPGPYPIPYRAITPHERECANLLVPVCLSGTHVALASVRMEPTYMVLGESAGIAAVRALEERVSVQAIDGARLRRALAAAGQILQWDDFDYGDERPDRLDWNRERPWWISHPEDYERRPIASLPKGPRRHSPWQSWLQQHAPAQQ